jgi:hypothetical protein
MSSRVFYTFAQKGLYDSVLVDCNKAILLNSKDAFAYYHRGTIMEKLNDSVAACIALIML